jgi:hypothetical protein
MVSGFEVKYPEIGSETLKRPRSFQVEVGSRKWRVTVARNADNCNNPSRQKPLRRDIPRYCE